MTGPIKDAVDCILRMEDAERLAASEKQRAQVAASLTRMVKDLKEMSRQTRRARLKGLGELLAKNHGQEFADRAIAELKLVLEDSPRQEAN